MMQDASYQKKQRCPLFLGALGVVYGDIGTSPLYALRVSLEGLTITPAHVLGILSLIFWSFILLISIKYLFILFHADNDGEGGILALLALIRKKQHRYSRLFFAVGILGTGLMLGDGMLTPAISVMSAVEGLNVSFPAFSHAIIPVTLGVLMFLFSVQSFGTGKIGIIFGPILLCWFVVIGILGAQGIQENAMVLSAINPYYAYHFFMDTGWTGFFVLGSVFLVMTGGEALYADLGHFGKQPIRFSWFFIVLPSLILNYFGQGAHLLMHPEHLSHPFYYLASEQLRAPLLLLATIATIIASQSVISATFSLTKQAVLLGLYPHLPIIQTSGAHIGQIYIPQMNFILAIGTVSLVLFFKASDPLTHAYGIAVNLVMLLTSLLVTYVAIRRWHWPIFAVILVFSLFGCVDVIFLLANLIKIETGGWVPILFASCAGIIMYTWYQGRSYLEETYHLKDQTMKETLKTLEQLALPHVKNTQAIFISDIYDQSGSSFVHFLKLTGSIPERVLLLRYKVSDIPYVSSVNRFEVSCFNETLCELVLHYGFMDIISIPQALYVANDRQLLPFSIDIDTLHYILEIPNVMSSDTKKGLPLFWQDKLFAFLVRNYSANLNIDFYQLPYLQTLAVGIYYLI